MGIKQFREVYGFSIMVRLFIFVMIVFSVDYSFSQSGPLESYKWEKRIVLLFGKDSDPTIMSQMAELKSDPEGMEERHMVIFYISETDVNPLILTRRNNSLDADMIRTRYNVGTNGFQYILIGKDGGVKLNEKDFVPNEKLYSIIDAMPMRRREMKEQGVR